VTGSGGAVDAHKNIRFGVFDRSTIRSNEKSVALVPVFRPVGSQYPARSGCAQPRRGCLAKLDTVIRH
jgi:hypothetical protein